MKKRRQRKQQEKNNSPAYRIYIPKGYIQFSDGQKLELYSIGVISDVLARDWKEIRRWELLNLIPLSPFCDAFGRRLYTKDMIRIFVRCAEEFRLPPVQLKCYSVLFKRAFFINLIVRLEKLYQAYKARLELKLPKEYELRNRKFLRQYVVQTQAYKQYMAIRTKGSVEYEAHQKIIHQRRSEAFWRRWRRSPEFRNTVYEYLLRKERYFERIGKFESAEKLRKGRRKYYDEDGNCLMVCDEKLQS